MIWNWFVSSHRSTGPIHRRKSLRNSRLGALEALELRTLLSVDLPVDGPPADQNTDELVHLTMVEDQPVSDITDPDVIFQTTGGAVGGSPQPEDVRRGPRGRNAEAGVWVVRGTRANDLITIDRNPSDTSVLRATVNGEVVAARNAEAVTGIRIIAGAGHDTVRLDETSGDIDVSVTVSGGGGNDQLVGGAADDELNGGAGNDSLEGGAGADTLRGGAGTDLIFGQHGQDVVDSGRGADSVRIDAQDTFTGRRAEQDRIMAGFPQGGPQYWPDDSNDIWNEPPGEISPSCAELTDHLLQRVRGQYDWYFSSVRPGGSKGDELVLVPQEDANQIRVLTGGLANRVFAGANVNLSSVDTGSTAPSHSGTNVQEAGVDEADIVKTDGNFIYLVRDGEFLVVDAWPADEASVVSRTEIEGSPVGMFVSGDRAVIFSTVWSGGGDFLRIAANIPMGFAEMPWGFSSSLKITVLDLADRTQPELKHESFFQSSYVTSREVEGQVYLVLNTNPRLPSPWQLYTEHGVYSETADHFQQRLTESAAAGFLPRYVARDYTDEGTVQSTGSILGDCSRVHKPIDDNWWSTTTVLGFDMFGSTFEPVDSATVFGYVNTVYASSDDLFMLQDQWESTANSTVIHKFTLGDEIDKTATGNVPGRVLNQFSVDAHDEYLRIATTRGSWSDPNNGVYVLEQQDDSLEIVGSVEGLAPGERIFSARFMDDHAFLVTFRQVDPLFSIDLSDPTNPQAVGELKVPGFSRYLHPIGSDYLLGVGRDADELGRQRGMQVSLFDVSDLSDPSLVETYLINPDDWTWSNAEWDHHAFAYFPEFSTLAIPIQESVQVPGPDNNGDGVADFQRWESRDNLWVFQVDASGLTLLGQIKQDGSILRSLRIENMLYAVGDTVIKVQPITDPESPVAEVELD